jgi:hypothetical protein
MKTLLTLLFSMVFFFNSYSQTQLPKIGTTKEKAFSDLDNGITNENWFKYNDDEGNLVYAKLFKGTPIGINHAMAEYEEAAMSYIFKDCIDKSIFTTADKKRDGTLNYEFLASSLRQESSEISKYCTIKDNVATKILLVSSAANLTASLEIKIFTKLKE